MRPKLHRIRQSTDNKGNATYFACKKEPKAGNQPDSVAVSQEFCKRLKGQESKLPFQTSELGGVKYKITAVVTNRDIPGDELIWWYRGRCGKSEEAHSIMKEDPLLIFRAVSQF